MTRVLLTLLFFARAAFAQGNAEAPLRPPAVPLVTHDPYFSVWSFDDTLAGGWTRHWTGATNALCGLARIDGKAYRFAGGAPREAEPMRQVSLDVTPTQTIYGFEAGGVHLTVTFLSPLLLDDVDLCSRPVSYLTFDASSADGKPHDVSLYTDVSAEWCVNSASQEVEWGRFRCGEGKSSLTLLRCGTRQQPVLGRSGDDLRIDWGHVYLGIPSSGGFGDALASDLACRGQFVKTGELPSADDLRMPRAAGDAWPVLACAVKLGRVESAPVSRHVLLAYDDQFSIEYFHRKLRPYWRRAGAGVSTLLSEAETRREEIATRCVKFDKELTADLVSTGGLEFARLATLAYRQAIAAHKIVADFDGRPLVFPKENFSNGCIATVDVIYPAAPIFLLFNPKLLRAQIDPIFEYANSARWPHPFAPHDLGTYPLANGQVYGGGEVNEENQMPVEESANMLLLAAALTRASGDARAVLPHMSTLEKWAQYLTERGLDPENQLCTDDFAGHLAHNANLSVKAILGIAAFAELCEAAGRPAEGPAWRKRAADMAARWQTLAGDASGYRLAFDKPGTWSQKYNLVWDRVLSLGVFPEDVKRKELALYKTKLQKFGLPLDNRADYTKLDWCLWTASLCENRADFDAMVRPLYNFIQSTPDRVPLTDWFDTKTAKCVGFRARSVVGGVYMPLLTNPEIWKKYASRAH